MKLWATPLPEGVLDVQIVQAENDAVIALQPARSVEKAGTILVVDDDHSVLDTFARMLREEGFRVRTAPSAEAALPLAAEFRPDALIVDMKMPVATGLDFLRGLRGTPGLEAVPVAIVTGDWCMSTPVQDELRSLGAVIRFKPLWIEDLATLAHALIASPRP